MPENSQECAIAIKNIINDTVSIMRRNDPLQTQLLKELGIEFNIELGRVNHETENVLKDKSWRNKQ